MTLTTDHRPCRLVLSAHAVDRWIERWRPGAKRHDALCELQSHLPTASFHEIDGKHLIYRTQIGALLVVHPTGLVKTVLPMGARKTNRRPRR